MPTGVDGSVRPGDPLHFATPGEQDAPALLLCTGLYLFVLPYYATKWRSGPRTG